MPLLKDDSLQRQQLPQAWNPFALPLAEAGLPGRILRKDVIGKLEAAGFTTLLDVRFSAAARASCLRAIVTLPPDLLACHMLSDVYYHHVSSGIDLTVKSGACSLCGIRPGWRPTRHRAYTSKRASRV